MDIYKCKKLDCGLWAIGFYCADSFFTMHEYTSEIVASEADYFGNNLKMVSYDPDEEE